MADERVSRILFPLRRRKPARRAAIIPLGPGSLRDSSSLPEGRDAALLRTQRVRAGPALPSYLALLHAGFSVPRMLPSGRWALTPPFHPCQMRRPKEAGPWFCRGPAAEVMLTGGIFSVALSVAAFPAPLARCKGQPPGVTRRVALCLQAVRPKGSESGLSSRLPFDHLRGLEQADDHPAHPPIGLSHIRFTQLKGMRLCWWRRTSQC